MKRLQTLGKLQDCFLSACEKIMLILPLDSAKIDLNFCNNFGMFIRKESRKNKEMCGYY